MTITSSDKSGLAGTLFGKARRAVLSLLYGHANESFYLRQIARITGIGLGPVQRELKNLTDTGIIIREVQGRQVHYRANAQCPIFNELQSLITKTSVPYHSKQTVSITSRRLPVPKSRLAEFCRRHHIRKLSLFGSVLREDFHPDSDIDVLVEFEPRHVPGLFGLADMEVELSALLGGRKVDLRTPAELSRYFRDRVMREAEVQYAAAR